MPSGLNQPSSEIEPIVGIQFGIFSPEEIERRSVVEITNAGTFDGNEPRIGGLFDPRMGVLDNGKTCRSCGQTNHNCPGHFGHYKLARPVYFIQFFPMVLNVLDCVCIRCSKLLIDKNVHKSLLKKRGESRWKAVLALCKNISRCGQDIEDGCGARQPDRFLREAISRIVAVWDSIDNTDGPGTKVQQRQILECEYVLRLFRRITDEDVDFMGLNRYWCRPDWMICSVMPIPPPQVRPSVIQDNNQRSEDDLTHKLFEIIQTNNNLQDKINNNANKSLIDDQYAVLQYHVATLVDNQIPGVAPSAQRSGRPLKSIQQRLGSKEGRIRYNIQGKRVEFSGRSVITPDPNISIEEIGVPIKIAMNLTVPDRVTKFNRSTLYKLVQNGADNYPGAKTIVRKDGRTVSLKHVNTKEIVLNLGDIVNRHLMDGDPILFNRQPTLHRMSMMGHKVKVLPYNTFRLNVSVTAPYNADFDGDEMNAHIPQSYEASIELGEIAAVPKQIITPRHAKPVIGIVQDSCIGSYRLTQPNIRLTRRQFMNMMMWNKHFTGKMPDANKQGQVERYNGQQVISQILPPINMEMGNSRYNDEKIPDNLVKIKEGIISQGVFDKDVFSKPSKGIIHTIFKDYGPAETVHFLDCMQNTVEQFLVYNGFSVGISDLIADEVTKRNMDSKIREKKIEVENIILQLHLGLFTNNTGKSNKEEFENRVNTALNKARDQAGDIGLKSLAAENRLVSMVRAGSKGGTVNIAQMLACLGQQNPEGKRIPLGFTDRTLPHYKKYDDSAEARGFVESSFIRGLSPQEFFFHAMSGREGLIDTAVKTADTGYIQRQLVKAMEDCVTQNDGSVRDTKMNIVQFHYGEDGTNATMLESQSLGLGKLSENDIKKDYGMVELDINKVLDENVENPNNEAIINEYVLEVLNDQKIMVVNVNRLKDVENSTGVYSPVNIDRLMTNIKVKFKLSPDNKTDLTPDYVIQGIRKVIAKTQSFNSIWCALLRFYLAPHKLIYRDRYNKKAFDTLCEMLIVKNYMSWAQPGEQVGIIAAQSIGEPSTQMTLNSVDYDTNIVIMKNGRIWTPEIGEFIDDYYESLPEDSNRVQRLPNNQIYIELNDGNDWKALSTDEDGKMMWTKLEAITRHPVINEDGSNTILEVTLESGRIIKATKALSFLTNIGGKVLGIKGSDLKVGDEIPIANSLDIGEYIMKEINLRDILPPTEWLYGTELNKAIEVMNGDDRHWFQKNQGKLFTIPYNRSDTFRDAMEGRNTNTFKTGCVYPKRTRPDTSHIPENIALTKEFGFFVGAYIAEGMSNSTQINITNNDANYIQKVKDLMDTWNVGTHIVSEDRFCEKTNIKGHTTSLVIHSTLLAKVMGEMFGKVSYEKTLPDWVLQASDDFVKGLVDAYISGDGTVDAKTGCIRASSVSKELIDKFVALFARYNIFTTLYSYMPEIKNFKSVSQNYSFNIIRKYSKVFAETFTLSITHKQDKLEHHFIHNDTERRCVRKSFNNIVWDKVKSIKEVSPLKDWVYDLTVEKTRNFTTSVMINLKDTFHLAGVSSKSNVTRGVPRLKELLKVTQNPKAISLTIPLKKEFRDSIDKARQVAQELELTTLKDIVTKTAIYFDPSDTNTVLEEDKDLIHFYSLFENEEEQNMEKWSKWLLRLEFDRDSMFNKNISMDDVAFALQQKFGTEVHLVYTDYNSERLIMRIRLAQEQKESTKDDILNLKKMQTKLLTSIVIRGIAGIKSVSYRKDTSYYELKDGKYEQITQYILDTDGSNFLEIINHPYVNGNAVLSSHVHDIYENLGIEAARAILLSEITNLFADAGGVDFRHLGLLCDWMTRVGKLLSVDRYGINKQDIGPLAKASFEETEKILLKAALFGEIDPVTGVSANIMTGQPIKGGTGFSELLLDEAALMRLQEGLPPVEDDEDDDAEEEYEPTQEDIEDALYESSADKCAATNLKLNVTLPQESTRIDEPDVDLVTLED
jgi:DNA-directed RNA polymerase II subunit RPB1